MEDIFNIERLINQATGITTPSKSLLDVILTNKADIFSTTGTTKLGLSDHLMIYGFLNESVKRHSAKVVTFRSKKNLILEDFKKYLKDTEWSLPGSKTTLNYLSTNNIHIGSHKLLGLLTNTSQ